MSSAGRAAALAAALCLALPATRVAVAAQAAAIGDKAQTCMACHGPGGNSTQPGVPSIAAQPAQFISMQLFQYREGNRKDAQMTPMAANLSNADMNALAAYFSAQKATPAAPAAPLADPAKAAEARQLAVKYNCVQCHGPALLGQQHIPRLAGQQRDYLRVQLRGFVAGTRADLDGNMTAAVRGLSAADVDLLADYLAGLGAP